MKPLDFKFGFLPNELMAYVKDDDRVILYYILLSTIRIGWFRVCYYVDHRIELGIVETLQEAIYLASKHWHNNTWEDLKE